MEILIQNTSNYVNDLVKSVLLPVIVDYVNQQDGDITIQDLEEVLQLNNTNYIPYQSLKKNSIHYESDYNKKCIWEYKRGKSKGNLCGKPTIKNSNYCSTCIKRFVTTQKQTDHSTKSHPIFDDIPKSSENDVYNLDLEVYDEDNHLYKDQYHHFVFKRYDEKDFRIIGKADNTKENLIHKLTNEDVMKAKSFNYAIDEEYDN
jgi:hypothetical protein